MHIRTVATFTCSWYMYLYGILSTVYCTVTVHACTCVVCCTLCLLYTMLRIVVSKQNTSWFRSNCPSNINSYTQPDNCIIPWMAVRTSVFSNHTCIETKKYDTNILTCMHAAVTQSTEDNCCSMQFKILALYFLSQYVWLLTYTLCIHPTMYEFHCIRIIYN